MANCRHAGGGCENPEFYTPHDIWVDANGDIYTSEVIVSAAVPKGLVEADCPTLQKFRRV